MAFIDLHLHTTCSDGQLTPAELLAVVRERELVAFSVTDHDTIEGYRQMTQIVRGGDPELLSGVELSVFMGERDLHLLAYLFDPDSDEFNASLDHFQEIRNQRGALMVEKLNHQGIQITFEAVEKAAGGGVIGRPHIAQALLELGAITHFEEAFQKYIGHDCPAYVPKSKLKPEDAIPLVHRAGGVAVAAHPFVDDMYVHLERLAAMGLDGVEVYHYAHSRQQRKQLKKMARRFGLIQSGGSDFHGRSNHESSVGAQEVPAEIMTDLHQRAEEIRGRR